VYENLLRTAHLQLETGDPLKRDELVAVRDALMETGWFDTIEQVRRTAEDRIDVQGQFVRPYAIIRDEDGDHLVDQTGKLLPLTCRHGEAKKFTVISGAYFPRPARPGMVWEGEDIVAGIRLLGLIDRREWRHQVREVDVSKFLKDQPLRLVTDRGCAIVWGGAPGKEPPLEILADAKLARLDFFYRRHKRIDGYHSGELDITGEKHVVVR
jgi:hypothetical protein